MQLTFRETLVANKSGRFFKRLLGRRGDYAPDTEIGSQPNSF
jgi:hypothetical protein